MFGTICAVIVINVNGVPTNAMSQLFEYLDKMFFEDMDVVEWRTKRTIGPEDIVRKTIQ